MGYVPPEIQSALLLQNGESTVSSFPNVKAGNEIGTLVLTNRRIIFMRFNRGYFQESFSLALEGIYELNMKSGMFGGPRLMVAGRPFQAQDLNILQSEIGRLRQARMAEVESGSGGKDGRYTMSTYVFDEPQASQQVVKEQIVKEVVKIRCQYCGKTFVETKDGCPYCGAGH
ncbi:MAG: hypothetical protein QCI38_00930 [Candidatus Thermoplasmatota archaeon]|nr:hypothetical protein [Candidatus Thermoplasmatota archaeon]